MSTNTMYLLLNLFNIYFLLEATDRHMLIIKIVN